MSLHTHLLKTWVDRLLTLQVGEEAEPYFRGGILCPACAKIHGRSGDTLLPFLYMAKTTGEPQYRKAAEEVFWWSEHNSTRSDGSYVNDPNNDWTGITVFSVTQLTESLSLFGGMLSDDTRRAARRRLELSAEYLYQAIDRFKTNVNYYFACGAALEIAGKYLGNPDYRRKGKALIYGSLRYIDADGLIFGEGKPVGVISKKGCRAIDIAYNVEETLPALVQYSISAEDEKIHELAARVMRAHMNFLLPDGAWDNSWCTRNSKWSYWGSRTSDGCQLAYAFFADEDPSFGEAAYRNLELMARCTRDGLLYGGPMYAEAGESACVHHTFCHAKGLALCAAHGKMIEPADRPVHFCGRGMRTWNAGRVITVRDNGWYASFSGVDYRYSKHTSPGGGSPCLLWHEALGPVLAATMSRYSLLEPSNMQIPRRRPVKCQTMRIEASGTERTISNLYDDDAEFYIDQTGQALEVRGRLTDADAPGTGGAFTLKYRFSGGGFAMSACVRGQNAVLYLPVIAGGKEWVSGQEDGSFLIQKEKGTLRIACEEGSMEAASGTAAKDGFARDFNPVGGFLYLPIAIELPADTEITVSFTPCARDSQSGKS